ncbi:hypothetical protein A9267_16175 [Shewanella sp. UCD-FRSSP16_17]|uniref:tetraspanin family protein n=1 Tax=Shewanella sp. UCD-FRSSP16_17 TaxID=1853256 RepID=UPI0007EEA447|nr:tetraspanin family protein [Shewanella sp. UCD-FRSSP16_17]OBT05388.1 hypothetical protein A9267_16175 [Shewanella sp. UCD-FRSSP16_17]
MQQTKEHKLAEIKKKMMLVAIIDLPGTLLLAIGLYGIVVGYRLEALPMLDNPNVLYVMMAVGASIMLWGLVSMFRLARIKQQIEHDDS